MLPTAYSPILRTKAGEFNALKRVPGGQRHRLLPLFELFPHDVNEERLNVLPDLLLKSYRYLIE